MKRSSIITFFLIITLLAAAYVIVSPSKPAPVTSTNSNQSSEPAVNAPPTNPADAGTYTTYSSDIISKTRGQKILFFHASWCPQCRALESSIQAADIPSGVTIIKVDYDTNQALRKKYGVTIQTTLVKVDDAGNLVKKYVAYDEPTFESVRKNLL